MPLEKDRCDECSDQRTVCPECGGTFVTPRDNPGLPSPNDIVDYGDEGEAEYTHVCWDCGWDETVTVKIERE